MPIGFEGDDIPDVPEPGNPGKTGRPPGPPPVGGGGGVGGQFFGGFGGIRPQIFRGLPSLNDAQLPVLLRKRGLQMPGVTPGAPGKSDTVPAMLTPGEVVMNTGVTQDPETLQMLLGLNQLGAQQMMQQPEGFEYGGVAGGGSCPCCGMPMPEGHSFGGIVGGIGKFLSAPGAAIAGMMPGKAQDWLREHPWAPLAIPAAAIAAPAVGAAAMSPNAAWAADSAMHLAKSPYVQEAAKFGYDQHQNGQQGQQDALAQRLAYFQQLRQASEQPQGFATGGMAGLFGGGFGRSNFFGRAQGGGQGGFATGGAGSATSGAGNDGFNYNLNKEGFAQNFNPNNPWGHWQANQGAGPAGDAYRLIGQAGGMGAFDPRGNQIAINQQIEAAQGTKDALVRRQMNAAQLGGLDPAQAAVAKLQALRDTGRGVQDISAKVRGDAAMQQDAFLKSLFAGAVGENYGNWRAARDFNFAKNMPRK